MWKYVKAGAPLLLTVLAIVGLALGAAHIGQKADGEKAALAAQAIRRAAVQCYALEGFYPADWSYLQDHYGVSVDESRFIVHYEFIASNLIPDVTVIARR